jgi:phosphatidylserine/phosphatidylglycerophosphate/cardiolipin synthase-like enzyme
MCEINHARVWWKDPNMNESKVKICPYPSPKVILLAFDWPIGKNRKDFLGFAIKRKPGFYGKPFSWLPNRISFRGPVKNKEFSSDKFPIQKFMWWDARINDADENHSFKYTIIPVVGTQDEPIHVGNNSSSIQVKVSPNKENGIGTYFNRAVLSSQGFSRKFPELTEGRKMEVFDWLADGLEDVIPALITKCQACEGAIYHLKDTVWVIPSFENNSGKASLVYHKKDKEHDNDYAEHDLGDSHKAVLKPRKRAHIMHNKFLVTMRNSQPESVLTGSANFTTEALTLQANLLHTFDSKELAKLFLQRKKMLESDPSISETAKNAAWSKPISIGNTKIRVFFSPEPSKARISIDEIIHKVESCKSSILFCIFSPTDTSLREAIFKQADSGKMMFGLINSISKPKENASTSASYVTKVKIYQRSRKNRDVFSYGAFSGKNVPGSFWWETTKLPYKETKTPFPVHIHHKFIIIDGETNSPIIYSGSANMSNNSLHNNDENLLEITGATNIAKIYIAEFFRLYEHYRARAKYDEWKKGTKETFKLTNDNSWSLDAYDPKKPEYRSRMSLVRCVV